MSAVKQVAIWAATTLLAASAAAADGGALRVLMIGNSFAFSVMAELPKIVESQDKYKLDITCMHIGGCSLQRHIREYERAVADPTHRPYRIYRFVSGQGRLPMKPGNLPEMLKEAPYDLITIQQASPSSFLAESWIPWGDNLVALVREKQPSAKIMIQQTWSYRSDSPRLKNYGFTSDGMYEKIRAVYDERAKHFGFELIPTGDAVQLFRAKSAVRFEPYPAAELKKFEYPRLPSYKGDVVGRHSWVRRRKGGKYVLKADTIHLNPDGQYLQGCLWFGVLFGADVRKIAYAPEKLSGAEAELLRECAALALEGRKAKPEKE